MTLRVSWLSSVMGNRPLWLRGSSFVSSWTDHKDRLGSCINRLGGGGGGGTIAVHVWGSFVLKPQKQVTHCLTNTYSLESHANKHTHTHKVRGQRQRRPKSSSCVEVISQRLHDVKAACFCAELSYENICFYTAAHLPSASFQCQKSHIKKWKTAAWVLLQSLTCIPEIILLQRAGQNNRNAV